MSEVAPAFSFYAKDFMLGTVTMSLAERGAYITLLAYQWDHGSVPSDSAALARICGCTRTEAAKAWAAIADKFRPTSDGGWLNPRLEQERAKQAAYRDLQRQKGLASARARTRPDINRGSTPVGSPVAMRLEPKGNLPVSVSVSEKKKEKDASLSSSARDPFTDPTITERAGRFIERYAELYPEHRNGARYAVRPVRDYDAAVTLCTTWTDDQRLEKLAVCFLTTDHKFAAEGSRTLPQFLALASWVDGELAQWEATRHA